MDKGRYEERNSKIEDDSVQAKLQSVERKRVGGLVKLIAQLILERHYHDGYRWESSSTSTAQFSFICINSVHNNNCLRLNIVIKMMDQNPAIESLESTLLMKLGWKTEGVYKVWREKEERKETKQHTIQEESHSILMWPLTAYLKATQKVLTRPSSIKRFGKALHTPTKEGNCYSSIVLGTRA